MSQEAPGMPSLKLLAQLLQNRAAIDREIERLIGRPPLIGNIGEFIAAKIFDIDLVESGSHAGYDGVFRTGQFAGATVNIKTYTHLEYLLDLGPHDCDFYLVMTGAKHQAVDSPAPFEWRLHRVFLFETLPLRTELAEAGVKIGVATSVRKALWNAAQVYPPTEDAPLRLSEEQLAQLQLFSE